MNMKKEVTKKELCQTAFLRLIRIGKADAALCLSTKLICEDISGSGQIKFGGLRSELEIIEIINNLLEGITLSDICDITPYGFFILKFDECNISIKKGN